MTRRSNEGDTVAVQIINRIAQGAHLKVTGITAACIKMTHVQRASQLRCNCVAYLYGAFRKNLCQLVAIGMRQGSIGTGFHAFAAEEAFVIIYLCLALLHAHSLDRADLCALAAAVTASAAAQLTTQTLIAGSIYIFRCNLPGEDCLQHL